MTLFIFIFFSIFSTISTSAQTVYEISIEDVSYEVYKIEQITSTKIMVYYNISILLRNSGLRNSDEITVEIIDNEGFSLKKNATIPAEGQKEVTWEGGDFFLEQNGDHYITINYYPTDETKKNSLNSGTDLVYLSKSEDQNTTPGFEVITVIGILLVLIGYKKYKI
jgi:hypothetical protein